MKNKVETKIAPPGLALGLAAAAYALCLAAPFTFDDALIFTADPVTRPLTWLTYKLNGTSPGAFHAVNLCLHLLAVWLCNDALRRILPVTAAATATILFAVHPAGSEAVNYVWARSALLMTVFGLLALRDWLRGRDWMTVLWFGLALASKEEAVALPFVLLLLDRRRWRPVAVMIALAAGVGLYTVHMANTVEGSQAGAQSMYSPLQYLASEGLAILRYLRLMVLPVGFTVDPDIPAGWWMAWAAVAVLVAFAARRFGTTQWGFWVVAGLILLLPSSSIFPANDLAADRRMYLPLIAFAAAAGLLIPVKARVPLAVALALLTAHRTWVWSDNTRLWAEAVEHSPKKVRPRVQLGRALPPAQAIPVLNEAKKIAPDDALPSSELGRMYLATNRPADALQEYGRALSLAPASAAAVSNRGAALAMLKQYDAARADFERALSIDPCWFEARVNLKSLGVATTAPSHCRYTPEQRAELQ